jgi:predicted ABC-type ATPase
VAKGGHSVDEMTIYERFRNGLILLDESFRRFNLVSIYLSKQNDIEAIAIIEPALNKVISFSPIPSVLTPQLPKISEFIMKNK